MPIYEYRRPDGSTFEVMQRMTEDPLTTDPESGEPVTRVFHPVAVHFKGKGFYNTDYGKRKTGAAKDEGGGDSKSESSDAKGESTSDSKSDSKADSKPDKKPAKTESKSASGD